MGDVAWRAAPPHPKLAYFVATQNLNCKNPFVLVRQHADGVVLTNARVTQLQVSGHRFESAFGRFGRSGQSTEAVKDRLLNASGIQPLQGQQSRRVAMLDEFITQAQVQNLFAHTCN